MALPISDFRDVRSRCARSQDLSSARIGAELAARAADRASALWPWIARSIANSQSMRVTASVAIGAFATWASS